MQRQQSYFTFWPVLLLLCALIAIAPSNANAFSPVKSKVVSFTHKSDTIYVSLSTPEGLHQLTLLQRSEDSGGIYFQGTRKGRSYEAQATSPAAADLIEGRLRVWFQGRRSQRLYMATISLKSDDLPVKLTFPRIGQHTGCAAHGGSVGMPFKGAHRRTPMARALFSPPRVIEISTQADREFHQLYGRKSKSEMRAILNAVEGIFTKQMGIYFKLVKQNVFTKRGQPTSSSNPETLLMQFQGYTNFFAHLGKADLYHLFTGKRLTGGTIGVAYVGTICSNNNRGSYGLTQVVSPTIQAIVTAHEIGHNLGAQHPELVVSNPEASIMSAIVRPTHTLFSAFSLSEISSVIETRGSCLTEVSPTVSLSKVRVTRSRILKGIVRAEFTNQQTCQIDVYASRKRSALKTARLNLTTPVFTSLISDRLHLNVPLSELRIPRSSVKVRAKLTCQEHVEYSRISAP